jgi:hypothetical protein
MSEELPEEIQRLLSRLIAPKLNISRWKVHTMQSHPDLVENVKSFTMEKASNGDPSGLRPDGLIALGALGIEDKAGVHVPTGPTAALIYLAEWLNEHPDIMEDMMLDVRWQEVLFMKPKEYVEHHPEVKSFLHNPF